MSATPSLTAAPAAVRNAVKDYLADLGTYFDDKRITFTATCQVTAATSVEDQVWSAGVRADKRMFVGSAVKTFMLAEFLRSDLSLTQSMSINNSVRSISSPVLGDETFHGRPRPRLKLEGQTAAVHVLEAMISHSDNTATDAVLGAVGVDNVRQLINEVGLSSVRIPESTRRLFTYLATGENIGVDWKTLKDLVDHPTDKQDPINSRQTMMASAADMVRWYQTALLDPNFFAHPQDLAEFKRISASADALHRIVPDGLMSYGKGGSITWNNFSALTVSGQMIMPTHDPEQPWMPLTFSFDVNWGRESLKIFDQVAAVFAPAVNKVLQASLDSFYWTVTDFPLTVGADSLTGTSGRDDFSGPGGGSDSLFGVGGDDTFHVRASQSGLIDGGAGKDTVEAIDSELNLGLRFDRVEALQAALPSLSATVSQLKAFSSITADAGPDFQVILLGEGGALDFSTRFVSAALLHVDATQAASRVALTGTAHDDSLAGSAFNDMLVGGAGDDWLSGHSGNDLIAGGAGEDTLHAGGGFDAVTYADARRAVRVDLAAGTATGQGRDTLANFEKAIGSLHDDWLRGGSGANLLDGGAGNDTIEGRDGDDRLLGKDGADQLDGGFGADRLVGGAGPDLFVFSNLSASTVARRDKIADFDAAGGDRIDLRKIDAVRGVAGDQAFSFIGGNAFSHTAGELNYLVSGTAAFLSGDVNGDALADFSVRLDNHPTLVSANILL